MAACVSGIGRFGAYQLLTGFGQSLKSVPIDFPESYLGSVPISLYSPFGEVGFIVIKRLWLRPYIISVLSALMSSSCGSIPPVRLADVIGQLLALLVQP
jgi:hypothetical protein